MFLDGPAIDPDPERKIGSPFPGWYSILKNKYESYLVTHKLAGPNHKFTLGKFSVFVSLCLEKVIPVTPEEEQALCEVRSNFSSHSSFFLHLLCR